MKKIKTENLNKKHVKQLEMLLDEYCNITNEKIGDVIEKVLFVYIDEANEVCEYEFEL